MWLLERKTASLGRDSVPLKFLLKRLCRFWVCCFLESFDMAKVFKKTNKQD
tara:strand:- start:364 stop:516 length:153 start_codon:yes stop_codon:yes gene_type:complete